MKKHYHIRQYSPLWWMRALLIAGALVTAVGLMNSWELGLL